MNQVPPPSVESRGIDPNSSDVRIIAVLGVIFGTLGLSCLPFNLGGWVTYGFPAQTAKDSPLDLWALLSTFIGLGLAALLLLSSMAAYKFNWWGRDGMLLWAFLSLLYGIVGIPFWGRFLIPSAASQYASLRGPDELAGLLGWLIGTFFSIFVLWYLTRPAVRAVFQVPSAQPSQEH